MERIAVYAGSFDVLTKGHMYVIEQGVELFDRLIVAVADNPEKQSKYLFNKEERLYMLNMSIVNVVDRGKIDTCFFTNQYLVDFCIEKGATHYLRGLRSEDDYRFERAMASIIQKTFGVMTPKPVWIPALQSLEHVASSTVKSLIGPPNWDKVVQLYVPSPVVEALKTRFAYE